MPPVEPWVEELGDRRVRLHGHRLRRPDGPFAETKEYVAGFDVLECDSLEEAVEAAAKHPVATVRAMEVRPFWDDVDAREEIRRLDAELTEAARERDVDRLLCCYTPDVAAFHLADGRPLHGLDAFRESGAAPASTRPGNW
ncbi:YciI family protein [Streptomyces sp. NPDC054794]